MKREKGHRSFHWIVVVLVVLTAGLGGIVFWSVDMAMAAERVLEPDRVMTVAPEPKSFDPLLDEGENIRFPTSYRDKTESRPVTEAESYRGFLLLVNAERHLPEDFLPEDLTDPGDVVDPMDTSRFLVNKSTMQLNRTVSERLAVMVAAAWTEDGIGGYLLQSGYRDYAYQSMLHQRKVQEYRRMGYGEADAIRAAAFWVARPGESEHQSGLALDLSSRAHPDLLLSYANTVHGRWLAEHSWSFGFVVRYPEDKTEITGVGYEPWHIRYVGRPHSDLIHQMGWCLEEYIDFLTKQGGLTFRDEDGGVWQIDWQPADGGAIRVPADLPCTVSGDGAKGFIITTLLEQQ